MKRSGNQKAIEYGKIKKYAPPKKQKYVVQKRAKVDTDLTCNGHQKINLAEKHIPAIVSG